MEASLYVECWNEVSKHKWIESEKLGADVGDQAVMEWFRRYWPYYCRIARLEHLAGIRQWIEFPDHDFNLIQRLREQEDHETIAWILEQAWRGLENLNMIVHAHQRELPVDRVLKILTALHLNSAQLAPPQFAAPKTLKSGH